MEEDRMAETVLAELGYEGLLASLRALARAEHDDLSVAAEASDALETVAACCARFTCAGTRRICTRGVSWKPKR